MWLVFAILAMLAYAATDLLGKRKVDTGGAWMPIRLLASSSTMALIAGIILFVCGFGESGRAPWVIWMSEPLILVTTLCFVLYWLLFLVSFRYLGLSIDASVGGTNSIIFFMGMLVVNMISGRLMAVREMLHPARIIPIIVVLIGIALLPHIEKTATAQRRTIVGMMFLILAMIIDGVDSLVTAVIFDAGHVGPLDFMVASWFAAFPMVVFLLIFHRIKEGEWVVPFSHGGGIIIYAVLAVMTSMLYLTASSHDAVRTGIVFVAEPIFALVGARVFLKERYTLRQNLCIWMIAFAAIAFCIIDGQLH